MSMKRYVGTAAGARGGTQEELGNRVDRRAGKDVTLKLKQSAAPDSVAFARTLGTTANAGDPRATHRTMAIAVSCGSSASQFSIVTTCGSSLDGM